MLQKLLFCYNLLLYQIKSCSNLTFLYSSDHSGFDFCYDYSFWNDTNKCYNENNTKYTFTRKCSAYDKSKSIVDLGNECTKSYFGRNCPNTSNKTECKEPNFYCYISKTCIDETKKCDGIKHCIRGEDEMIETCHDTYPESATVDCIEPNRPANDIWIKAVRCNGVPECKNGEDEPEECEGFKVSTSYFHFKDTYRKIKNNAQFRVGPIT